MGLPPRDHVRTADAGMQGRVLLQPILPRAPVKRQRRVPGLAKRAAGLSLLLWIGIAIMGRGIGYIEPPFGIHA
jgi:hypothetical protein